jgi:hypothetical protein
MERVAFRGEPKPFAAPVAGILCALLIILHVSCIGGYGYFRDELYYLACAARLDWGYVDQPPLSIVLLRATTMLFGDSLWSLRMPTILAGALTLVLIMRSTAWLGGDKWAQGLAGLCFLAAPVYRIVNHLYSMNGLDVMFWSLAGLLYIRVLQENRTRDWTLLGVVLGLALMNKLSALWLIAGLGLGLLLARRETLATIQPYMAGAIALLVAKPHLVWQVAHAWPTVEFVENANRNKLLPTAPWQFVATQIVVMNPFTLPVWLGGLVFAFRHRELRPLGIAFATVALILMVNGRSRENYLAPAYPLVMAAGAVWFVERARERRREAKPIKAYLGALGASGMVTACLALPLLPLSVVAQVIAAIPVEPPAAERGEKSPVQGFGDMIGWREQAEVVAEVYRSLPEEDRGRVAILTYNYGEAAALERFGTRFGLPVPISTHNNYWIWGPRGWDGRVAILLGDFPQHQLDKFSDVHVAARVNVPLAMPEEGKARIRVARGLRVSPQHFWDYAKRLE